MSARARVAYALALGHAMLPRLAADVPGHGFAQRALIEAERWLAAGSVSPQALTDFLIDEREEGLLVFEQRCTDPARRRAWIVVESAIAYAAWQAWRAHGQYPAALVSEVGEDTLELLNDQAVQAGLPKRDVDALRQRVEALSPAEPVNLAKLIEPLV